MRILKLQIINSVLLWLVGCQEWIQPVKIQLQQYSQVSSILGDHHLAASPCKPVKYLLLVLNNNYYLLLRNTAFV